MRKFWLLLVTASLFFAYSGMAGAASPQKPIQVFVNGSPVTFAVDPVAIDSRTFVEFRSLFSALGYEVDYVSATKTIVAESADRVIKMTVGSKLAYVNDEQVQVDDQLKIVDSRTLVGVRFIATLSGKDVTWVPETRTVEIVDQGPTPEQEAAVFAVLNKLQLTEAAHDYLGYTALFADDSSFLAALGDDYKEQWERVKTRTTILEKTIVSYSADTAVLQTEEKNEKVGGEGFSPDYEGTFIYTLTLDGAGEWKIDNLEMIAFEVTNAEELLDQAVTLPDADAAALKSVLEAQLKATADEDVDGYMATMFFDDESIKQYVRDTIKQVFEQTDSVITIDKFTVVDYYGTDKATIVAELSTEVQVSGQTIKVHSIVSNDAEKRDGKWLLDPAAAQLKSEQL